MKRFLDYNKKLKERAAYLRKNMTAPEKKLWNEFLRSLGLSPTGQKSPSVPLDKGEEKSISKLRVMRQRIIQNYIVDFYIPKYRLVIEIDGDSHYEEGAAQYDQERTEIFEGLGLKVLRYTNQEVMNNFEGVCEDIGDKLR